MFNKFCPVCGGSVFDVLVGGRCSRGCVYCKKAIYCKELFSDKIEGSSLPIKSLIKAIFLRFKYNRNPENKKNGEENLKKHKEFLKEIRNNARRIKEAQRKAEESFKAMLKDIEASPSKKLKTPHYGSIKEWWDSPEGKKFQEQQREKLKK